MTYAHLLKNDDRHAAEQATSLLIGHGRVADIVAMPGDPIADISRTGEGLRRR
jgi:hypothetical protein